MAVTHKAPYAQSVDQVSVLATAGVTQDATTSDASVGPTIGANGGLCVGAQFNPVETTTAGIVWLFLSEDAGATYRTIDQQTVAAETITATSAAGTPISFKTKGAIISEDNPLRLGASDILGFGFCTTITPSSVGHVFSAEVENF